MAQFHPLDGDRRVWYTYVQKSWHNFVLDKARRARVLSTSAIAKLRAQRPTQPET